MVYGRGLLLRKVQPGNKLLVGGFAGGRCPDDIVAKVLETTASDDSFAVRATNADAKLQSSGQGVCQFLYGIRVKKRICIHGAPPAALFSRKIFWVAFNCFHYTVFPLKNQV